MTKTFVSTLNLMRALKWIITMNAECLRAGMRSARTKMNNYLTTWIPVVLSWEDLISFFVIPIYWESFNTNLFHFRQIINPMKVACKCLVRWVPLWLWSTVGNPSLVRRHHPARFGLIHLTDRIWFWIRSTFLKTGF
jgi:hypothetical protein